MLRILSNPKLLLPFMIMMGVVVFGMRIGDVWESISSGRLLASTARAETRTEPKPAEMKSSPPVMAEAPKPASNPATDAPPAMLPPVDEVSSPAEMEVLKQLSARRDEIEKRSRSLDAHDNLIKIAEQRVDQKVKELQTLRLQLQSMISQVSETQAAQLDNLVKIYETMKPDEAAKIFETLDMPTLLNVIQRMKAKSTAPIMAKLPPEKAKDITMALTRQDQLPQIK
jgi:hypothetical protein